MSDSNKNSNDNQAVGDNQVLTFLIDGESFALDILAVKEIYAWHETRDIPGTPPYIVGVHDWRGTIVPVIDMRIRFGDKEPVYHKTTVIVILQTEILGDQSEQSVIATVGIVVDAVSDVVTVTPEKLKESPSFGSKIDTKFIKGLISIGESMAVYLDVSKLINLDDLS